MRADDRTGRPIRLSDAQASRRTRSISPCHAWGPRLAHPRAPHSAAARPNDNQKRLIGGNSRRALRCSPTLLAYVARPESAARGCVRRRGAGSRSSWTPAQPPARTAESAPRSCRGAHRFLRGWAGGRDAFRHPVGEPGLATQYVGADADPALHRPSRHVEGSALLSEEAPAGAADLDPAKRDKSIGAVSWPLSTSARRGGASLLARSGLRSRTGPTILGRRAAVPTAARALGRRSPTGARHPRRW
jgi:hypothetical protein